MAILVTSEEWDPKKMYKLLKEELPSYAMPYFVRRAEKVQITSTYKHKKAVLVKEGFDPKTVKDDLFVRNDGAESYEPLTRDRFAAICLPTSKL